MTLSSTELPRAGMLDFPATRRNRDAILEALKEVLAERGRALEIAAGSGQHAVAFAAHFPGWTWIPTDLAETHVRSIEAWRGALGTPNLKTATLLDVHQQPWACEAVDLVFCANMIHIAPWSACEALMEGASRVLLPGGRLVLYGPFIQADVETAASNLAFDADLRSRDPSWGVRELDLVKEVARAHGLRFDRAVTMPANNLTVMFQRT